MKKKKIDLSGTSFNDRDADFSELNTSDTSMENQKEEMNQNDAVEIDINGATPKSVEVSSVANEDNASPEVAALKAEVVDLKDKYLRALAEVENVKKRAMKERSDLIKYQGEKILLDVLEVADNLERALGDKEDNISKFRDGVALIYKLLMDSLGRWEVRGESAVGKDFDPFRHRALGKVAAPDAKPNTIVAEMRKPFFYKDKLLRVGEVIVAAEQEKAADTTTQSIDAEKRAEEEQTH